MNNNNNYIEHVYNSYKPINNTEEMTEERKQYLLEKERMIQRRKRNKKIFWTCVIVIIVLFACTYLYKNYFRPVKIDPRIDKNSIHYVTNLYYSDGRYYEKYLDNREKKFYLHWLNDLTELNQISVVDCRNFGYDTSQSCFGSYEKIYDVILMEHPDLFWYRTSSIKYNNENKITLTHYFVSTNKLRLFFAEKKLLRKIDEITTKYENKSDYEKVKSVYTWLGAEKSYSLFHTRKSGTAWSALLDDNSVCAGYAAASQLLFQRLNIESTVVIGQHDGGGHAWNFVFLEDGYYWYDSTVGGTAKKDASWFYNGFLFKNTGKYSVNTIDLRNYNFGTKYLDYN